VAGSGSGGGNTPGKWLLTSPFIVGFIVYVFVTNVGLAALAFVLTAIVAVVVWITDAGFADSEPADGRHARGVARNRAAQERRAPFYWRRLPPTQLPPLSAGYEELSGAPDWSQLHK